MLATGATLVVGVRLLYPSWSFLMANGIPVDSDKLKTKGYRSVGLSGSTSFTSCERNIIIATEQ